MPADLKHGINEDMLGGNVAVAEHEGLPVRLKPGSSDRRSALAYGDSEVLGDTFSRICRCEVGVVYTQVLVGVEELAAGAELVGSISVE